MKTLIFKSTTVLPSWKLWVKDKKDPSVVDELGGVSLCRIRTKVHPIPSIFTCLSALNFHTPILYHSSSSST